MTLLQYLSPSKYGVGSMSPSLITAIIPFLVTVVILSISYMLFGGDKPYPGIPVVGMERGMLGMNSYCKAKMRYVFHVKELFDQGRKQAQGKCYQVLSLTGFKIIIPPKYLEEIKNDASLSFGKSIEHDFFARYPGFGAFEAGTQDNIIQDTIKIKMSGNLGRMTEPLSQEMAVFLQDRLPATQSKDWKEDSLRDISIKCIAQLSSRVFLGNELCRDPRWLDIAINYTIDAIQAARAMRMWPRAALPIVHWLLPQTKRLRKRMQDAHDMIVPIIEQRHRAQIEQARQGLPVDKPMDSLQWIEDVAKGRPLDTVKGQLLLSFASIHTTSALLQGIMYDLCDNSEYIQLLREEIIEQLSDQTEGWSKQSLHSLKMMDSVMKESQRLNTVNLALIQRRATGQVELSDGTIIPLGAATIMPTAERMLDPAIWPDSDKFIGRRFYDFRMQAGNENKGQFVTLSNDQFGFGAGIHACPGRFFASNETKVILIHLLMKYDWKFPEGKGKPRRIALGHENMWDPNAMLMVRARKSEIGFPWE